jgi:hypothetical protein
MNETTTNFFEALERPMNDMPTVAGWQETIKTIHDAKIDAERLTLSYPPFAISDLWTWSLQFEIPIWFIALLALGLALSVLWHLRASFPAPVRHLRRNRREHDAQSLLTSLR